MVLVFCKKLGIQILQSIGTVKLINGNKVSGFLLEGVYRQSIRGYYRFWRMAFLLPKRSRIIMAKVAVKVVDFFGLQVPFQYSMFMFFVSKRFWLSGQLLFLCFPILFMSFGNLMKDFFYARHFHSVLQKPYDGHSVYTISFFLDSITSMKDVYKFYQIIFVLHSCISSKSISVRILKSNQ